MREPGDGLLFNFFTSSNSLLSQVSRNLLDTLCKGQLISDIQFPFPEPYSKINLSNLKKSNLVNIEIDILSKYVRNYFNEKK